MKKSLPLLCVALATALGLSSCETPGETALLGAGLGAISGNGRHVVRNAAIGAGAGYLIGKIAQERRRDEYYDESDAYDRPPPSHRYAVAQFSNRRGFVISPYSGNLIDVRGIPPGAHVVDPSVDRVFINP